MSLLDNTQRFCVIVAICAVVIVEWWIYQDQSSFPSCSKGDYVDYMSTLKSYVRGDGVRGDLKAECVFSERYSEARQKFLKRAINIRGGNFESALSGFAIERGVPDFNSSTTDLVTDYLIMRGSKTKFLFYLSGTHGSEGFAGSGIQCAILDYLQMDKKTLDRYSETAVLRDEVKLAEEDESLEPVIIDESKLPPTIVMVHIVNPFGMHHNRRVNEDNIDINRNYLQEELFDMATTRDPNFAGYLDLDFMMNPKGFPSRLTLVNDFFGHLRSAYALLRYGLEPIKKTLLAGNYFRQSGIAFGGLQQSASVQNLISLLEIVDVSQAEQVTLIDLHTGLGPSGTDTLLLLNPGKKVDISEDEFSTYIEDKFPGEVDPREPSWRGGMKAISGGAMQAGSAASGYDLTIGTVDNYCQHFLAPHLVGGSKMLCITQEFGTVDTVTVGKSLIDENTAWHHGSEEEKALHGRRLKAAFYVQNAKWMRSVVHRGLTLFKQAFTTADQS